ncbi:Ig-like domain-containing protein [Vibrio chagasii]|uniref:Ig-like domain-containing protein n=1 Tax=Vibrio chagasii TaxID=170679 RepID=UPI003DA121E7
MNTIRYILIILISMVISACGDETGSKEITVPPTAENFIVTSSIGKEVTVDIEPYISDKQGFALSLSHVAADNGRCRASITGSHEITLRSLVKGLCDITYTITNGTLLTSGKISAVSNNNGNVPFLPTISRSAQVNNKIDIDILAELNALGENTTGLTLMSDISSSSGSALVHNNNIIVTPSLLGATEVVYTLSDTMGNIRVGTVVVSTSGSSFPPVALPYDYPIPIFSETDVTVDIAQLKDQNGSSIIKHPQGKPLQLISIKTYGASVRPTNPNDVTNTSFTLNAPKGVETQDVTYTVADHNGGYASNIISFDVFTPTFAQAITITTDNAFADGSSLNQAKVQVIDKKSKQPIKGVKVSWLSESGVVLTGSSSQTDHNGFAHIAGTSTQAGSSKLTAIIGITKAEATWSFSARSIVSTTFKFERAWRHELFVEHDGSAPLWIDWGDGVSEPIISGSSMEHYYTGTPSGALAIKYYQGSQPNITSLDISKMMLGFTLQDLNTLPLTGSLKFSTWDSSVDAVGNLADLPQSLTKDLIVEFNGGMGSAQITGTINDIPKSLTGSVILQMGIDGDLVDLPTGLEGDLSLMLKSTAQGHAADLPRGLKGALKLQPANKLSLPSILLKLSDLPSQLNTTPLNNNLHGIELHEIGVSGTTSEIPRAVTALDIENGDYQRDINISGDIIDLPRNLEALWLEGPGNISLSGDIANLPRSLERFAIVYRFGYIDDPTPFNDHNTLHGDIADLPKGITVFKASGQNTISGNVKDIISPSHQSDARPSGLYLSGLNTIEGDVKDIPLYDLGYGWASAPVFIMGHGKKQLTGNLGDFDVISPADKDYYGNLTHLIYETSSELLSFTCDLASLNNSNISSLLISLTQQPCDNTLGNQLRLYHLENITINVTLNGSTNHIIPYTFVNDLLDAIIASSRPTPGRIEITGIDNASQVEQQKVDALKSLGWTVSLY